MSEVKVNIDLDLDTKKAKSQLDDFKNKVKDDKIPVKLDIENVKGEALALKNVLSDAFKMDSKTLGNLKQVEDSLKQINTLLKNQSNLANNGNKTGKNDGFMPISINKNTDIIKDVNVLVDDYKKATDELRMLDTVGQQMKEYLNSFNKDQEDAFKKFANDSKSYDVYLKELQGDNITDAMKKAINARKKAIQLQEELTEKGVMKVNNDQLRNETSDGSIFTIENEKWKAMFAKSESEAKELEDLARKLQPKILKANSTVEELLKDMSDGERKLVDEYSKAYEQRPKMYTGYGNDNANTIRMYLESMMPDVDKIGLDFDNLDDIFRGLNRYFSRLEQMQNEYNAKFSGNDDFKALRLDSLIDIDKDVARKAIEDIENNTNQLEQALKSQYDVVNRDYGGVSDLTISGVNEQELSRMKEFIRLSELMGKSSSGEGFGVAKQNAGQYLATIQQINNVKTEMYKAENDGKETNALRSELALLEEKRDKLSNLINVNTEYMQQELALKQARKDSRIESIDSNEKIKDLKAEQKATEDLEKSYKQLDAIQDKLSAMQKSKGFLDNDMIERTNALLSETRSKLDTNGIQSDFKDVSNSVELLNNSLRELNAGNTLSRQEASFNASLQGMENRVDSFIDKCREMGNAEHLIERVEQAFRDIDTSNIERANVDLRQMTTTLQQAEREARQLSSSMNNTRTFFGNFGEEFRDNLFTFTAGELLADGIRNLGQSLKTLVMETDAAMTNLKKVANPEDIMNINQLENIQNKANQIAKNVGQSSQDTIQAIADTIQMAGLGMEESIMVAEQTMKLANVAEMTQQAASEGVVTMLSAFNLDPLKEIPLVVNGVTQSTNEMVNAFDMINHVGNNFAISSDGILDSITSGANVLAAYGVSMNDTIAMITAANTTLQDTSRVGNGLKTLATRLSGVKASAKDGTLSLNKTAMALKEVADIDVIKPGTKDEIKDMATLIEELGSKWESFSDFDKAGLSEALAGAQQAAVFQSLMQNLDVMKDVQSELGNGEHWQSMEKENAQYVDSLAGQLNKLKETWVGIFNAIFSSDATKSIIKGLVSISEAIATVITKLDEVGMLTPMLAMLGVTIGGKVLKGFSGLSGVLSGTATTAQGVATTIPLLTRALNIFGVGATGATTSMGGLLTGLSTAMPYIALATVTVGGLAVAYDYFNESLSEEKQRLEESISTRKSEIDSIEEQKKSLSAIADEYDNLSKKPNKTNEEVERLKTLTNEVAKIMPDLVVGYDENGNAIINMTGDVSGLIKELDSAIDRKNRLLKHEQGDLAENSVNQLYGKDYSENGSIKSEYNYNKSEMGKLEQITEDHVNNMSKLEQKRDKLIGQLYGTTGKERQEIAKDLEDINYQIEKSQADFNQDYLSQLDVIKEYSDKIGEGLFSSIENGSAFKDATEDKKKHFQDLKNVLDFSDIKTEEQLFEVERSLNQFLKAANVGKVDIKGLENNIKGINDEFAKTGDLDSYNESMNKLAKEISEVTGVDANILTDLFTEFDTSVLNSKDSLDEFLGAFGKTKADLLNDNGFAKALANQKQSIDDWVSSLNDIGYSEEIDLEIAYDLMSDSDLPEQVRDMVRTLLNKGHGATEVLDVAQQVLIDLSDGEVDVQSVQDLLDRTFGQGAFEVDSKLLLNPEAELAGVDDVVSRLKEKYGEIPTEIETSIRVDSVTSYIEAERILSIYNNFPDEVKTVISSNSFDTVKDLELIQQLFTSLPPEQAMQIVTNYSEIIKESGTLEEVLGRLSKTPIQIEPVVKSESATNALDNLVKQPVKDVIVGIKGDNTDANKKVEETDTKVNDIKQDTPTKVEVDNISANNRLKTTKSHLDELKNKTVTVTVNTVEKKSSPGVSGNISDPGTYSSQVMDSKINNGNEIALLSDSSVSETVANTSVEQLNIKARAKNPISTMDSLNYNVNALKNLENQLKKISNELDFIAEKSENAFGKDKINYLERQIVLYQKQQDIQHQLAESMRKQQSDLKSYLSGKGVQFSADGDALNYAEKMLAIEKEIERLNKQSSDNKDNKNPVDNSAAIDSLNQQKEALETYLDLTFNKIPAASEEWWSLYNSIEKTKDSIENIAIDRVDKKIEVASEEELAGLLEEKKKLLQELANKKKEYVELLKKQGASESQIEQATYEWKKQEQAISDVDKELEEMAKEAERLANDIAKAVRKATEDIMDITQDIIKTQQDILKTQVDLIDKQMQLSSFDVTGTYEALEQKISLLEREKELQKELGSELEKQKNYYKQQLSSMGISFDTSGIATNAESVLNNIKNQMASATDQDELSSLEEKFNDIVSTLKDYNSALKDVASNQNSMVDIQLEIENIYEEMLNTTKKMEDKITDIISKQVEERKKKIDEELKKRLDNLKKEQDAYNENRNKEDWEKENSKKLKELEELQAKIEAASRDTSLAGQAKLAELLEQMAQKQEDYNDFIQDKIDNDVNDMYDKESDRIQEEADKAKEDLDKNLDKEELYETIKNALETGQLKDIDGNLIDLKDAILDYEDKYGDGLSVIGGLIKKDLLSQLDVSYDTMKNIENILKTLNLQDISKSMSMTNPQAMFDYSNLSQANNSTVNFNESLITVNGNVTPEIMPELKRLARDVEENVTRNIMKKM